MKWDEVQDIIFRAFSYADNREIAWFYNILEKLKLKNGLEIGVACGTSLIIWEKLGGFIIGVDNDLQSKAYGMLTHFIEARKKNIELILGNSEDPEIIEKVKSLIAERMIDFLFIDGSHEYEDVKQDYLNYGSLVKKGGVIAFHDICHVEVGANRFWKEIKEEGLRTEEYANSNGIGVIHVEK